MRWRLVSFAFVIASVVTGISWLSIQPPLAMGVRAVQQFAPLDSTERTSFERLVSALPAWLLISLVTAALITWGFLYLALERPLKETEALLRHVGGDLDQFSSRRAAPLLSRFHSTLHQTFQALAEERVKTSQQLEQLRARNAELAKTRIELSSAERLATIGRLSAGIAHEVGNPLSGILGYLSLIEGRADRPAEVKEFLRLIGDEVRRIDSIIKGLLELGRPARGEAQLVELVQVVERCLRLVRGAPEFGEVVAGHELTDATVRADPGPIAQILINLLLNAAQAMQGKGRIWITARREGADLHLFVDDSGPGLPAGDVFEPFFTTKGAGEGTGLGLAVSRHLARAMKGELIGGTLPDGGARFTLILPAA